MKKKKLEPHLYELFLETFGAHEPDSSDGSIVLDCRTTEEKIDEFIGKCWMAGFDDGVSS